MPYSSIIFDLDGTLLDTLADLAETSNAVLTHYNFPIHQQDAYKKFVGDGLQVLIERITPAGTGKQVIEDCCSLFAELYAQSWKKNCCPYDGILDMLTVLKTQSINLAVLSNKPHAFTEIFIDEFFTKDTFSLAFGQRQGVPKKPNPAAALEIVAKLGCQPDKTLFVGDTGVDMQTGKAAGMVAAGVSWGFRSVGELQENGADVIVYNPMELADYAISFA